VPDRRGALVSVAAAAALAAAVTACGSSPRTGPPTARTATLRESPEPFRDAEAGLRRLAAARASGGPSAARALARDVLAQGKRLVAMERPEDLARENVARFLEARARFVDALNDFDRSAAGADDDAFLRSSERLERAFWLWHDAYRGVAPSGAV
jgi:hypothetical protein